MSHSLAGFPVRLFSHTMALKPHPCARGVDDPLSSATPTAQSRRIARGTRARHGRSVPSAASVRIIELWREGGRISMMGVALKEARTAPWTIVRQAPKIAHGDCRSPSKAHPAPTFVGVHTRI